MFLRAARGRTAEDVACRVLLQKGYVILERNVRFPIGELDIVAREGATLAFVEVRARSAATFGQPYESITPAKRARLLRLAEQYLARRRPATQKAGRQPDAFVRFDVVSVLMKGEPRDWPAEILKGAFEQEGG